jgi:eukaryotic-like serine/threonine-protein kinase
MTTSEEALTLGDILDDLALIGRTIEEMTAAEGDASYEAVQERLSTSLNLHLLGYVRFLEDRGALIYNRISDTMELTETGKHGLQNVSGWTADAELAFAEQLGAAQDVLDPDDMTNVVDIDSLGRDFLAQFDAVTGGGTSKNDDDPITADGDDDSSRLADIAMGIDDLISEVSEASVVGADSQGPFSDEEDPATGAVPLDAEFSMDEAEPSIAIMGEPSWSEPEQLYSEPEDEPEPEPEPELEPVVASEPEPIVVPEPPKAFTPRPEPTATPTAAATPKPSLTTLSRPHAGSPASRRNEQAMRELYERIEEIGSGGIGTVYRARQVKLNRDVAVKEVREIFNVFAGVQRDDIIGRFTDIVQTHSGLLHPNIVQIIDVETDAEYPFLVMQYAPNGNLRRLIDVQDRPPLGVALKYFFQILHALNAAHDRGIVHGSIKPENVVLDRSGNALLTDFGISRVVEREGGRGNQVYVGVGTVAYMSPEQFQDPNKASVKSDIYSLGIMLYEMLTGKVPGRRSPMPSSFYPDIPRKLDDVFDCMSMDREEDRYNSIDEIIAELYASPEVMKILDKRSGVLFLRDPIVHGEHGLAHGNESEAFTPLAEFVNSHDGIEPAAYVPQSEPVSFETGSEGFDAEPSEVDETPPAAEEPAQGDDGDGGVLDKLNKYGELFEED